MESSTTRAVLNVQYLSDLHMEFMSAADVESLKNKIQPSAEVLVLAGDIGDPFKPEYMDFISHLGAKFTKVFVIAGNHEYYRNNVDDTKEELKRIGSSANFPKNISFLENSYEDYRGTRFIGSTLWTEITDSRYKINDISCIRNFSIEEYNRLHRESVVFLKKTLDECNRTGISAVVITHHLPIYELTHEKYRNRLHSKYSSWFNATLDPIVLENAAIIKCWIYGHTHMRSVQNHYGVEFLCNPLGYSEENHYDDINMVWDETWSEKRA